MLRPHRADLLRCRKFAALDLCLGFGQIGLFLGGQLDRRLVDACWDASRELEIKTVFTLTYVAEFFEKCGYHRVEKTELPHKIWNECVRCPLFPSCTESALIRSTCEEPALVGSAAEGAFAVA